jgi:hypothetical protein
VKKRRAKKIGLAQVDPGRRKKKSHQFLPGQKMLPGIEDRPIGVNGDVCQNWQPPFASGSTKTPASGC